MFELREYDQEANCQELTLEETLYVLKRYASGLDGRGYNRMSFVYAFHNVFFLQWALNSGKFQRSYKFSIGIEQED